MDTHALSEPAQRTALEALAGNGVDVLVAEEGQYTPTPVISHAILTWNREIEAGRADGIVITPSHNPPSDGGFKYNPPHGGPADTAATTWIEDRANALLESSNREVRRLPYEDAISAPTVRIRDFVKPYGDDLDSGIDMAVIPDSRIRIGAAPLGGARMAYWEPIAERYGLDITLVDREIDPTFRVMTVDHDGKS